LTLVKEFLLFLSAQDEWGHLNWPAIGAQSDHHKVGRYRRPFLAGKKVFGLNIDAHFH
jgi:hypothetical protein